MSALIKAIFITVLLALIAGSSWAAEFNSLQVDAVMCISATDAEVPKLDDNGNPIILPEEEEEDEEPDCE